ncbi:HlyD family type I secretion membrane fusion protein [Brevundimonas alba]|uniref:Membrane fusion protein (MFP) family protein n=1 Tax=Brevundimonas alba TaxID=74314 RepID=A0A7X5YIE1_9CAUL|nr:HlyD family type I secretion periplasmic adaptor subunit [Brevundimonas alba]NJC40229.1 HlyD family type I secretion membrane fusion protein [Brevundimonas alba]
MKLHIDPDRIARRMPLDWLDRYRKGVSGPEGALDDSRRVVRIGLIVMLLFFGLLLLWGAFAPLSGAAVASGVVTVAGNRQSLQTLNGGVVDQVLVREGQKVGAGQILVRMNGLSAGGRYQQSQAQKDGLRAAEARLVAERDNLEAIPFPSDLLARQSDPGVQQVMANQTALFTSRKRVFDADRAIYQARVRQAKSEADSPRQQLAYLNEQVRGMRSLYARGFAPKSVLFELERTRVDLEAQAISGAARAAEAELVAARADEARTGEVVEQLRLVQSQLQQVNPQLAVARYNAERDVVRAPVAGAVVDLSRFAPGSILSPGQKIMDLLPEGRAYVVEARIKPEDIDDVRVGSRADVRFTTVHPRGPSKVGGVVTTLSADRLTDPATGAGYYLAYIALDAQDIRGDDLTLTAGLPASINIRTKDRSLLDYLFAPLLDAFSRAGREE